jgi:hypothetical protein
MSKAASVLGVFALAANPMFLFYAGYPLAHVVDICVVTWGMFFLWRWWKEPRVGAAIGAGLALGFSVTLRATDALLALVVVAAMVGAAWRTRKEKQWRWQPFATLLAASAVFPLLYAGYNAVIFGGPLTTGYALSNEQAAFSLAHLGETSGAVFRALQESCLSIFFPLGLVGLLVLSGWTERLMRVLWFVPVFLVYCAYYWVAPQGNWSNMRFLMAVFPLFIGAALALLDQLSLSKGKKFAVMAGLCVAVFILQWPRVSMLKSGYADNPVLQPQKLAADKAAEFLRPAAVIFARQPAAFHINRGKKFRLYDLGAFDRRYWSRLASPRTGEPRRQPQRTEKFKTFLETNADSLAQKKRELVQSFLEQGRQVAYLIPKRYLTQEQNALGKEFQFTPLAEWDAAETFGDAGVRLRNPAPLSAPDLWVLCEVQRAVSE